MFRPTVVNGWSLRGTVVVLDNKNKKKKERKRKDKREISLILCALVNMYTCVRVRLRAGV